MRGRATGAAEADIDPRGQRRYHIRGTLGRGAFGTVFRAEQLGPRGFRRKVALKVLNRDVATHAELASRLRDEARLLGMVRHRAIVQVDGLVLLDGRWTIVMELVEGADLGRLLKLGPVPVRPALEVVAEVAGALHAAHTGVGPDGEPIELLHRDLKPTNLLLSPHGEVKVVDFGVARGTFAAREARTSEMTFGTPGYVAPERMNLEELPAGDVYALGCVLVELLAGRPMGENDLRPGPHTANVEAALEDLEPAPPPGVAALVRRLLAHDPERRPTAREVEREARDLLLEADGPWLRDWAEDALERLPPQTEDLEHDFSDSVIIEKGIAPGSRSGNATVDIDDSGGIVVTTWDPDRQESGGRAAPALVDATPAPVPRAESAPRRRPWLGPAALVGAAVLVVLPVGFGAGAAIVLALWWLVG